MKINLRRLIHLDRELEVMLSKEEINDLDSFIQLGSIINEGEC